MKQARKYYKVTQNGRVLEVNYLDIDEYITLSNQLQDDEVIDEIDEEEANDLKNGLTSQYDRDNEINNFSKKIIILNWFNNVDKKPSIKKLEEYFNWLNK